MSIDMDVANRFISSLSKSLQALCHGCMEFDSRIEIMGYINVNIDCGSKVDYVLNEKVQKGHNNSMTFVSNSFLAKKDQNKSNRDGVCSPIQELQFASYPHSSGHRDMLDHQYGTTQRSHSQFSTPYSQYIEGPQKRPRSGKVKERSPPKKHVRHSAPKSKSIHYQSSHSDSPGIRKHSNEAIIKKESYESDQVQGDAYGSASVVMSVENLSNDSSSRLKSQVMEEDSTVRPTGNDNYFSEKDNFLQHSSENGQFVQSEPVSSQSEQGADGELTAAIVSINSEIDCGDGEGVSKTSIEHEQGDDSNQGMTVSFVQNGDGSVQQSQISQHEQPLYPDQATTSGEGAGFDVIEIGDEDEDFHAMFGDNRKLFDFYKVTREPISLA